MIGQALRGKFDNHPSISADPQALSAASCSGQGRRDLQCAQIIVRAEPNSACRIALVAPNLVFSGIGSNDAGASSSVRFAAGWPFAPLEALAEQRERQKLVGIVSAFVEAEMKPLRATFVGKLSALGWKETDDLEVELARGNPAALAEPAAALAQRTALLNENRSVIGAERLVAPG